MCVLVTVSCGSNTLMQYFFGWLGWLDFSSECLNPLIANRSICVQINQWVLFSFDYHMLLLLQ